MTLTYNFPTGDATVFAAPSGINTAAISATDLFVDYQAFRDGVAPYTDYSGGDRDGELIAGGPAFQPVPDAIRDGSPFTMVFVGRSLTSSGLKYLFTSSTADIGIQFTITGDGDGFTVGTFYNDGANTGHQFGDPGIDGNTFCHLALTWDGDPTPTGVVKAYVNGVQFGADYNLEGTLATVPDGVTRTHRLRMLNGGFDGEWQWMSVYKRRMTDGEIAADYTSRKFRLSMTGIAI